MKQEKMLLELVPSSMMDVWAKNNKEEHNRIRLSKRARSFYNPSESKNIYLKIQGLVNTAKLKISQAVLSDVKEHTPQATKTIGFVTTDTYNKLMGDKDTIKENKKIWISENTQEITVGADPEFVLVGDKGDAVYADTVLTEQNKWNQLGSDGPCAELRPLPSNDVENFVNNIAVLLNKDTEIIDKYDWIGGATYKSLGMNRRYPIGGHLHFGLPNIPDATLQVIQKRIVRILDELVAIPLIKIDTPLPEERRSSLGYGRFEDTRHDYIKFEWRVPSGIWLAHKDIAYSVIGASKAVVEECWKRYEDRDHNVEFMTQTNREDTLLSSFQCLETEKVRSIINASSRSDLTTELLNNIFKRLKGMSSYCRYKESIDGLIKICSLNSPPIKEEHLHLRNSWVANKPL